MGHPAWIGLGAQRSGTTWLTDLLTQHPQVGLGENQKKEQQLLHKVADGRIEAAEYFDLFPDNGTARGEWSPQYLRHASTPTTVAQLLPDSLLLVLLRDPVARFKSAMSLALTREQQKRRSDPKKRTIQLAWPYPVPMMVQTWTGFYADQLAAWAQACGRDRMMVMVHEEVRNDPQGTVDAIWSRLGVSSVPLGLEVTEKSHSSSKVSWEWTPGLQESLTAMYRPQYARLEQEWGLDLSGWASR